ncbi:MAG: InlB B-repeat-containing protein [Clostridiales Family XIII bacterium]|jgi:uncharacterized repeat protein (TIGR02543 family)|nr:InlB B-repeat-containing protein [Clostridiales Family XIII bacterium]
MNKHTAAGDGQKTLAFLLGAVMIAAMFFVAMPQNAYAEDTTTPVVSAEDSESGEEVTALADNDRQDVISLTFTDSGTATIYNKWTTTIIVNGGDQTNIDVNADSSIDVIVSVNDVVTITESENDTFREWGSNVYSPLVENVDCELTAIPAMNVFTEDTAGTTAGNYFFYRFNSGGALTSLPEGSFDTSDITHAEDNFFCGFNADGDLTSLPEGSFNTSNITVADNGFFDRFNDWGALTQGNKGVVITNNSNQTITDFSSGTDLPETISTGGGIAYINTDASYIPAPTKYLVTFNANGGGNVSGREVTAGAAIGALPQAARTGYAFKGWYTAASGGAKIEASALVTAAVTYFAQWTANSYTVTHNVNGGKALSSKAKTKTVKYDSAYGELAKTTRAGYTFKGWYTAKSGGTKITNTTKVQTAKDHTLHAQWTAKNYTATFNANGGKVSPVGGGSKAKTTKMKVTYSQKFGKLPVPTRAGYKFAGWYTAKSGGTKITKTSTVKITKNTTYYARWTKK